MIAKTMWEVTVRRIQGSRALKVLAVLTLADYLGFLWLSTSERLDWTLSVVMFIFSIGCWFWAVTWPPFWNKLTIEFQGPGTRRALSFVERFGLVTLFFVQTVYSAILVTCIFVMTGR